MSTPQQMQQIWKVFDSALEGAESNDTKHLVAALRAHAELMNTRLAPLEHLLAALIQQKAK